MVTDGFNIPIDIETAIKNRKKNMYGYIESNSSWSIDEIIHDSYTIEAEIPLKQEVNSKKKRRKLIGV